MIVSFIEIMTRIRCRFEKVYRLNTDLTQREKIEDHHLEEISLPEKGINEFMIRNKENVIGRYVKLGHTVYKGQIVDRRDFEHFDDARGKPLLLLEPEEVLMSAEASMVNTGGNVLRAGDYVNLSVKLREFDGGSGIMPLLKGVRVVNVRDRDGHEIEAGKQPSVFSFAIPQKIESIIHKALEIGDLSVVICNGIPSVINDLQKEVVDHFNNIL
ncbi:hypothetical protein PT226_02355 [Erysipelothrix rhusiopathiae]|nr:hypothetical protein [Erysipelothrix rhusiopathiae]